MLTTLLGALVGALVWWPLLMNDALDRLPDAYQTWPVILLMHVSGGLFALACALAALWLRYRPAGDIRAGLRRVGSLFALGAALAVVVTVAFARSVGFRSSAVPIVTEIGIALACCALGAGLGARWWQQSDATTRRH